MNTLPRNRPGRLPAGLLLSSLALLTTATADSEEACTALYRKTVLDLPFNPAFLKVEPFPEGAGPPGAEHGRRDALLMSSFFNVERDDKGEKVTRYFERDLVAWIPDIAAAAAGGFDARRDLEILTDRAGEPFRHVWPNESSRVPDGVVPFEAIAVPDGFLSTPKPGGIALVNLDDPRARRVRGGGTGQRHARLFGWHGSQ